jgi:hypothetical protein
MTIAVSLYTGGAAPGELLRTFACAYCAGVMLTLFLNAAAIGGLVTKLLHCDKHPFPAYLVSSAIAGALMGVFVSFFIIFMSLGPTHEFLSVFLHVLPFSVLVSAISTCCWAGLTSLIVHKVYDDGHGLTLRSK